MEQRDWHGRLQPIDPTLRFWDKVQKTDGCWLWTGAMAGGKTQFSVGRRAVSARRFAYELVTGQPLAGLSVRATCGESRCVRPEHVVIDAHPGATIEEKFWRKVDRRGPKDCWEWRGAVKDTGYGVFRLDGKTARVHRLVYEWTHGAPPAGLDVAHRCDNRICVNPAHLFTAPRLNNMRDCVNKGRHAHGEKNGHAKLTVEEVREIRRAHAQDGAMPNRLAKQHGVTTSAVHAVVTRRNWKRV